MNPTPRMCSAAVAVIAGLLLSSAPSLALAAQRDVDPQGTVRYDDLDLSKPAAVRVLYARIEATAQAVCGPSVLIGSRAVSRAWNDCVNGAVRRAILSVNEPELTAYYAQRLGAPPATTSAVTDR